jgi:hypothetical protein
MEDQEWKLFLDALEEADDCLKDAFALMDGIDGFTPAGEAAYAAARESIRAVREAETAYRESPPRVSTDQSAPPK